jgi:hypothetical protein
VLHGVGKSANAAVPEPSTWAMTALSFAGYHKAKTSSAVFAA